MKKVYIKPTAEKYLVNSVSFFAASVGPEGGDSTGEGPVGGGEENQFAKDTSWEDDDDLDGGSAIW